MEHSQPIEMKKTKRIKTVKEDVAIVEATNFRLRHSADKLAKVFGEMI